ncbi:pseudouridine synthase [Paracoccus sediminicola]|uniref:pseudouridine synthase n=1 Tax=Paracoccus sediminicola TaxID=3017783 RepID=UPI0022F0A9EB|nr:pseudouridine synthase [Paracoccus sediminicola]WBU57143.1 pseudouridine synthase [Paracoccus sediminicola]
MTDQPNPDKPAEADRIAKVIARAGLASRREAERMIVEGRVTVNGKKIDSPALDVLPSDKITVDGKKLEEPQETRLWLYYKPVGLVTSENDEKGRQTVFDALPRDLPRVMSVGRLDLNSEGLLLLTNDGELKRRLELPETGWLRRYRVRVNGQPNDLTFAPLRRGAEIDGEEFAPMEIKLDSQQGANAWLTVGIREGKNREIRRAMAHVGLQVNRLIRIGYGPFKLTGLEANEVREIKRRVLRDQLGGLLTGEAEEKDRPFRERGADEDRRGARSDDRRGGGRDDGGRNDRDRMGGPRKFGGRRPDEARGPREDRETGRGFARRGDGDRKPYASREDGDRKPYARREDGDRKPYARRHDGGQKSYHSRDEGARGRFGARDGAAGAEGRERRRFGEGEDGARKPRHKRGTDDRPARDGARGSGRSGAGDGGPRGGKNFEKRSDKPFTRRDGSSRADGPRGDRPRTDGPRGDRPRAAEGGKGPRRFGSENADRPKPRRGAKPTGGGPRREGKPGPRPGGKPSGRPGAPRGGKPAGGKPGGGPRRPKS